MTFLGIYFLCFDCAWVVPDGQPGDYPRSFWRDFRDHNIGMFITNNALTPDPELEPGPLTSSPWKWFALQAGIRMSAWSESSSAQAAAAPASDQIVGDGESPKHGATVQQPVYRFYMLGNPVVWWASSLGVAVGAVLLAGQVLIRARARHLALLCENSNTDEHAGDKIKNSPQIIKGIAVEEDELWLEPAWFLRITLGAWAFNYLPFFLMGRVTYLHHYYPALVMAILNVGVVLEWCLGGGVDRHASELDGDKSNSSGVTDKKSSDKARHLRIVACVLLGLASSGAFLFFSPLAYGMSGPIASYANRRWLSSWKLIDDKLFE